MQKSWTTVKTESGDFSDENLGNLPGQIVVTLYLIGLTNKFESAVQANSVSELAKELDHWTSNLT